MSWRFGGTSLNYRGRSKKGAEMTANSSYESPWQPQIQQFWRVLWQLCCSYRGSPDLSQLISCYFSAGGIGSRPKLSTIFFPFASIIIIPPFLHTHPSLHRKCVIALTRCPGVTTSTFISVGLYVCPDTWMVIDSDGLCSKSVNWLCVYVYIRDKTVKNNY